VRSVPHSFWHEFRGAFGRLPVWLPGTRLQIGDIGLLDPNGWTTVGTLSGQNITCEVGAPGAPVDFDYRSVDGTEVMTEAAGTGDLGPMPGAGVSAHYRFSRQGAFVVRARAVRARQIKDLAAVGEQVISAYQDGNWRREWLVVTELATSESIFILVAGRAGAEATVHFDAFGSPATAAGPVAADAGVRLSHESGLTASFVSLRSTTLMWSGRYIRDPRFGRTTFDVRGHGTGVPVGQPVFAEVSAPPAVVIV
jgi:hypothetical protein